MPVRKPSTRICRPPEAVDDVRHTAARPVMRITLKLYATLTELLPASARRNAAEIDVDDDVTLNQIIDRFQVPRELAHLVLLNGVFICDTDRDQPGQLTEGDTLAIWPPVAGG